MSRRLSSVFVALLAGASFFFTPQVFATDCGCEFVVSNHVDSPTCEVSIQKLVPVGSSVQPEEISNDLAGVLSDLATTDPDCVEFAGAANDSFADNPAPAINVSDEDNCSGLSGEWIQSAINDTNIVFKASCALIGGTDSTPDPGVVVLENPIGDQNDIAALIGKILEAILGILGSVTLLMFFYGGFLWLVSAGNAERVKKGVQTMTWAAVGVFIIFGSYAILRAIISGLTGG